MQLKWGPYELMGTQHASRTLRKVYVSSVEAHNSAIDWHGSTTHIRQL